MLGRRSCGALPLMGMNEMPPRWCPQVWFLFQCSISILALPGLISHEPLPFTDLLSNLLGSRTRSWGKLVLGFVMVFLSIIQTLMLILLSIANCIHCAFSALDFLVVTSDLCLHSHTDQFLLDTDKSCTVFHRWSVLLCFHIRSRFTPFLIHR